MQFPIRINKYLAEQKIASRREADSLIEKGLVFINGEVAPLGAKVGATDKVEIKDKLPTKKYLVYYKGRGVITHSPQTGEIDIASKLAADYGLTDVYPVGRLDKDSEGLILLTNDGRVTGRLLDPQYAHEREYLVCTDKSVNSWFLRHLESGVDIEGYQTKPAKAQAHPTNKHCFTLVLTEGKKHQIRRMCAALGYQITSLKRTRIAFLELKALKPNQYRKLNQDEINKLLTMLELK